MIFLLLGSVFADPGAALADAARRYLSPTLAVPREDCSGWVDAVLEDALAIELPGAPSVEQLRELLPTQGWTVGWGSPQPGDLVFFHGTRDKDGDHIRTRLDPYTTRAPTPCSWTPMTRPSVGSGGPESSSQTCFARRDELLRLV